MFAASPLTGDLNNNKCTTSNTTLSLSIQVIKSPTVSPFSRTLTTHFPSFQSFLFHNIVFSSCFISKNVISLSMVEVLDCK